MNKRCWVRRAQDELGSLCAGIDLSDAWKKYCGQVQGCFDVDKRDADGRPVRVKMTFVEWLRIWLESGHWHERGVHRGQYVMSRHNDLGDYAVGNVSIKTTGENLSEAQLGRTRTEVAKQRLRETLASSAARQQMSIANPNRIPVVFRGVAFPSIRAASKAFGVHTRVVVAETIAGHAVPTSKSR